MVLRGVLEKSFGSFLCLRGFATLKELADCSEPDDNYQREDDNEHVAELKDFYEDRKNLFFPEIVLAISLQDFDASSEQSSWLFGEALNGKGAPRQKLGELTISTFAKEFKHPDGSRLIHTTASIIFIPFALSMWSATKGCSPSASRFATAIVMPMCMLL